MTYTDSLEPRWQQLLYRLKPRLGRKPNLQSILFLIGVQELGSIRMDFSKEEKQDLMHVAVCSLLEPLGYFIFEQYDSEGWPHYRPGAVAQPDTLEQQEIMLKQQIILYFEEIFESL